MLLSDYFFFRSFTSLLLVAILNCCHDEVIWPSLDPTNDIAIVWLPALVIDVEFCRAAIVIRLALPYALCVLDN